MRHYTKSKRRVYVQGSKGLLHRSISALRALALVGIIPYSDKEFRRGWNFSGGYIIIDREGNQDYDDPGGIL